jgi:hypothetical protein
MVEHSSTLVKGQPASEPPARSWPLIGRLSPIPDWSAGRALALATLGVTVLIIGMMAARFGNIAALRDTDDATRLVMVRDLLAGRGWYDQAVARFDPPNGVWMHWSRLLDGGIAGMMLLLRPLAGPAGAEFLTRFIWPLLWIAPGVAGALAIARNLGARSAVFLTALLLIFNLELYRQFVPGRIDHHNVQIVMAVVAMACATAREHRGRWAVACGAAAGLGMAVGLEAMPLQALIGASYGLALMRDRQAAGPAGAYGLGLAATTLALFAIETPPWRWSMSFCDEIAANLVAGVAVAGLGLALAALAAPRAPAWARVGLTALAAVAAGAVYLGLDPACIHGPFAAMNPVVKPFWFDRIQEVQPLNKMFRLERAAAIVAGLMMAAALISALWLAARQWRAPTTSALLLLAAVTLACVTAWFTWRMQDYVFWIGVPAMGAAASYVARRWLGDLMIPSAALLFVLAPGISGSAADWSMKTIGAKPAKVMNAGPMCFAPRGYRALAALPPGKVLAPQDMGPFILAYTPDSVVAAPYHRMWPQILAVHRFWNAPPAAAEGRLRALEADYVVDCPPYPLAAGPNSFAAALRKGVTPPWLKLVSPARSALKIYRVLPPAT